MKYFAPLLFFVFSCNQKAKEEVVDESVAPLGKQLLESGFLKFADSVKLDSLKLELINSFDIYDEKSYKIAHVDAEELAEFSFDFFLPRLSKMLQRRAFKLEVQTANDYEKSNDVLINGVRIKFYTKDELEKADFWDLASRRFFKEVNNQLKGAGVGEAFYLLYTGNDLHVLLLSDTQQKIIAEYYKANSKEIPYLP
jgi:hypothetical protein